MKDDRVYLGHIVECPARSGKTRFATGWSKGSRYKAPSPILSDGYPPRCEAYFVRTSQRRTHRDDGYPARQRGRRVFFGSLLDAIVGYVKGRHPELPWAAIAGFRNVLVHDCLGISLSRVWDITQRDLPALRAAVVLMLAEMETRGPTG